MGYHKMVFIVFNKKMPVKRLTDNPFYAHFKKNLFQCMKSIPPHPRAKAWNTGGGAIWQMSND